MLTYYMSLQLGAYLKYLKVMKDVVKSKEKG